MFCYELDCTLLLRGIIEFRLGYARVVGSLGTVFAGIVDRETLADVAVL